MVHVEIRHFRQSRVIADAVFGRLVRFVISAESGPRNGEIFLRFVSDPAMSALNRRYTKHRGPTDVLCFELMNSKDMIMADIVIATDTARRNARQFTSSVAQELYLYVIHGLLHMLGYDDTGPRKKKRMQCRQGVLLDRFVRTLPAS